jgi:hypothetical protein
VRVSKPIWLAMKAAHNLPKPFEPDPYEPVTPP